MNPVEIIPIAVICVIAGAVSVALTRRPRETAEERSRASAKMKAREIVRENPFGDAGAWDPRPLYYVDHFAPVIYKRGDPDFFQSYTRRSSALRAARRLNEAERIRAMTAPKLRDFPSNIVIEPKTPRVRP